MSGFICGKTIKDNSTSIDKLEYSDDLVTKNNFYQLLQEYIQKEGNKICSQVSKCL